MQIKKAYELMINQLKTIYEEGESKSIARIVFEDAFQVFNTNRIGELSERQTQRFEEVLNRLVQREPVQYVLGEADFYGLKFKVDQRVLIPRQETEELVHWILESVDKEAALRILDIGTGSGCIPITLKTKLPAAEIHALDVSPEALALAQENADLHQKEIHFHEVDILDKSAWTTLPDFDVIVSNPPYIPHKESHLIPDWVKEYEPNLALFVTNDKPLVFYDTIAAFALSKLKANSSLFFESNEFYAQSVKVILEAKNMRNIEVKKDLNGKERMLKGMIQ